LSTPGGNRAGLKPTTEYWADLIAAFKEKFPEFLFIAKAYWDREWELQQQGFDYCYDKRLYDHLRYGNAAEVRAYLRAGIDYQASSCASSKITMNNALPLHSLLIENARPGSPWQRSRARTYSMKANWKEGR
jgi:hypothetical protein